MKKMNSKLAIMVAAAALCLSGCGAEPTIPTENSTIEESVSEMATVESEMATVESEMATVESEMATVESESANVQIDYDVQKVLEEAEQEATALQKKLQEDPSLTQADMNMLSMEIYQVWDDVLNDLWKNLKVILDEDTMSDLLVEQRAWIAEKEAEVKQAGEEVGGGSLAPLVANQKAAELTRTRVYELASYLGF